MSVEIAIINKNAVTLVSNSKTIINRQLSEIDPVGIMVYGNPYLMGIHWESLIYMYKDSLKDEFFPKVEDYANHFIEFLQENVHLFSEDSQDAYFYEKYSKFIINLKAKAQGKVEVLQKLIEYTYEKLKKKDKINLFDVYKREEEGESKYVQMLNDAIEHVFTEYDLGQYFKGMLFNIGRYIYSRGSSDNKSSGIIIAGFGHSDLHPTIVAYEVDSVIDNMLIYRNTISRSCDAFHDGNIYQFKLNNILELSQEIDMTFRIYIRNYIERLMTAYTDHIVNTVESLEEYDKVNLRNTKNNILENFYNDFDSFITENYMSKMISSINMMSKDEMIEVGRSMINLIDFKARNSLDSTILTRHFVSVKISRLSGYVLNKE